MDEVAGVDYERDEPTEWFAGDIRPALADAPKRIVVALIATAFACLIAVCFDRTSSEFAVAMTAIATFGVGLVPVVSGVLGAAKKRYRFDSTGITIAGAFMTKHIPWKNVRKIQILHAEVGHGYRTTIEVDWITIESDKDFFSPRHVPHYWDLDGMEAAIRATKPDGVLIEE